MLFPHGQRLKTTHEVQLLNGGLFSFSSPTTLDTNRLCYIMTDDSLTQTIDTMVLFLGKVDSQHSFFTGNVVLFWSWSCLNLSPPPNIKPLKNEQEIPFFSHSSVIILKIIHETCSHVYIKSGFLNTCTFYLLCSYKSNALEKHWL